MIKTEPKEKIVSYNVYTITCDYCGESIEDRNHANRCYICGDDICNKCVGNIDDSSDYPYYYCKRCWVDIGGTYRTQIEQLKTDLDKLEDEWYLKCRK